MRQGQGVIAAKEIARALSLIEGLYVVWFPRAIVETRGFNGILYLGGTEIDPAFARAAYTPQRVTWRLEVTGPTDVYSDGSTAEAQMLDLASTAVDEDRPVSVYDAVRNFTAREPDGWGHGWKPLQPTLVSVDVYRSEEADTPDTVLRADIMVDL